MNPTFVRFFLLLNLFVFVYVCCFFFWCSLTISFFFALLIFFATVAAGAGAAIGVAVAAVVAATLPLLWLSSRYMAVSLVWFIIIVLVHWSIHIHIINIIFSMFSFGFVVLCRTQNTYYSPINQSIGRSSLFACLAKWENCDLAIVDWWLCGVLVHVSCLNQ